MQLLMVGVTTCDFSCDNTGDIKWDQPNAEVPAQTGPATGTLFMSYLRGAGCGLFYFVGGLSGLHNILNT